MKLKRVVRRHVIDKLTIRLTIDQRTNVTAFYVLFAQIDKRVKATQKKKAKSKTRTKSDIVIINEAWHKTGLVLFPYSFILKCAYA